MVKVDLTGLVEIAKGMTGVASDSDDVVGRLQQLNNEMSYDTELLLFLKSQTLLQDMSNIINDLRAADDMVQSLRHILADLPDEYERLEKRRSLTS